MTRPSSQTRSRRSENIGYPDDARVVLALKQKGSHAIKIQGAHIA